MLSSNIFRQAYRIAEIYISGAMNCIRLPISL